MEELKLRKMLSMFELIPPSSLSASAFEERKKLTEVELCEGLVEIGHHSFAYCEGSVTNINIPNSLRRIFKGAFIYSLQTPIRLHDGIEIIGEAAFTACIFTNFRIPPLINVIHNYMLWSCPSMFSVELPENKCTITIGNCAFSFCPCLRNVAFPPSAVIGDDIFKCEMDDEEIYTDLRQLFGSEERIVRELHHRFDRLPIHFIVYYQSYYQRVLQTLIAAINLRSGQRQTLRSKLDPTGNQQVCLGMTPLHILACSSIHDLELYRVLVERYPTNLITEDRWGALPLLYAIWGATPSEIIQFLLESYQHCILDMNSTGLTWWRQLGGQIHQRKELRLGAKQMHFPDQPLDWEYLLNKFAQPSNFYLCAVLFQEQMRFLVMCGMSMRVEALPFKVWRNFITVMIHTSNFKYNGEESQNQNILRAIREKLAHFEDELPKLKEAATLLKLALWKKRIDDTIQQPKMARSRKKTKTEVASSRQQCRVTCGADVIIRYVIPFLTDTGDDDSLSNEPDTDDWSSDESSVISLTV